MKKEFSVEYCRNYHQLALEVIRKEKEIESPESRMEQINQQLIFLLSLYSIQ